MEFPKEYKDFQAQALVIKQKLALGEELSKDDINIIMSLTKFNLMDSFWLNSSVLIFGKIILHLSEGALKSYQKKGKKKNGGN